MGLRTRLLLLVLLPVIPALVLALYSGLEQRRFGMFKVEKQAITLLQLAAANQVALIEATRQNLAALSRFPQARANDIRGFDAFFANLPKIFTDYTDFGLIETNGQLISCTFGRVPPTNHLGQPHFERVLTRQDFAIGTYQAGDAKRKPSLLFGHPVFDDNGRLLRVVYAALDLSGLNRATSKTKLTEGGALHIFDSSGHILASSTDAGNRSGKSIAGSPMMTTVSTRREGTAEVAGPDGIPRLYAFMPFGGGAEAEMFLAVGISTALAFRETEQILIRNFAILGLIAVLVVLVAHLYADWHILHPVKALVGATKQLAKGDLAARTGIVSSNGELNQLAHAFDEMAESVERQQHEIERSREALRESEERLRLVLDTALDAVITIDEKGDVASWNGEAERIFGWTRDDIIGRPLSETIIPRHYREAHSRGLRRFLETAEGTVLNQRIEITGLRRDGSEFPLELAITPIRNAGNIIFSAFVRDITQRKKAEAEIHALNATLERRVFDRTQELEAANKELEAFSYSVSHDLRAPLRHIAGYIDILREDPSSQLSDSGLRCVANISKSAKQLGTLVDDLLAFSRIGRTTMQRIIVSMNQLVSEVIQEMTRETQGRSIDWKIDPLPEASVDRAMLKQVWVNLLSNAVKYTRHRERADIEVRCRTNEQNELEFSVRDNGAGFDTKYAGKLFRVFERLHPAEKFEGTGIGLANVHRIITRHGGRCWAEGKVDEGATFYFTLPRQREPGAPAE